jgi:hypothetical protein
MQFSEVFSAGVTQHNTQRLDLPRHALDLRYIVATGHDSDRQGSAV